MSKSDMQWLIEASIVEMQQAMKDGRLTAEQLVLFYMERIATYDTGPGGLNSVLEVNPDALHIAAALDRERKTQGARGPLHGIPVLLKDNIDTKDKTHTSAGSLALANHYAKEDAFVAKKLRQAGAVILGKANMTEWANFMTEHMPNGYSSRGGQVLNPYGPGTMDVSGSSSGSASAVAANLVAVAIGTDTSGSILSPSILHALVGIRPTMGLVSRQGIIPISHSQDTAGPMTRTVTDCAILLGALTGADQQDPITLTSEGLAQSDYTTSLDTHGLCGARIGIPAESLYREKLGDKRVALMDEAVDQLNALGAIVIRDVEIPGAQETFDYTVLKYEFKPNLNAYLQKVSKKVAVHSLTDLINFNNNHANTMLKYGQTLLQAAEALSGTLKEQEYVHNRMRDLRLSQREGIDYALRQHGLDAICYPAYIGMDMVARAGYPGITVPAGYVEGRPFALMFASSAYSEPVLIKFAYAFEQATKHRKAPIL